MLKWLIRKRLAAFERQLGYDTSYLRALLAADTRAFLAFARVQGISSYRKDVPLGVYYAAKLTGTVSADCGPCTQLVVTMALHDGLDARTIATILGGVDGTMSEDLEIGVRFARAVLAHAPEADELRQEIVRRWGPRALASLGLALVASQMYPTLKYALGYGRACQRIVVGGETVVPGLHETV